jgi:hypothetical protein
MAQSPPTPLSKAKRRNRQIVPKWMELGRLRNSQQSEMQGRVSGLVRPYGTIKVLDGHLRSPGSRTPVRAPSMIR